MTARSRVGARLRLLTITVTVSASVALLNGMQSLDDDVRFEVASVKPNVSGRGPAAPPFQPGGRFTAGNATLHELIQQAYQVHAFQVIGGPQWASRERWDILARAPGNPPHTLANTQAMRRMLRTLLADRFKLRVRRESRQNAVYDLVLARRDRRLGARLMPSPRPCGGPPPERPCGYRRISLGGEIRLESSSIAALASSLGPFVQRIIVDRTGLTGNYDLTLEWNPELTDLPGPDAPAGGVWSGKPGLFTALQEQLGLKLQAVQGAVDVLVIDDATRPTPD